MLTPLCLLIRRVSSLLSSLALGEERCLFTFKSTEVSLPAITISHEAVLTPLELLWLLLLLSAVSLGKRREENRMKAFGGVEMEEDLSVTTGRHVNERSGGLTVRFHVFRSVNLKTQVEPSDSRLC